MKNKKLPFWFRNLQKFTVLVQEETGPRVKNSPTLGVLFQPESLIQRFFHFWTNYNDTISGLPRTVMNQLFQRHIKRRTIREWDTTKRRIDMLSNRQEKSNALILVDCFRKGQKDEEYLLEE